jgi:hypothetical protein
MKSKPMKYRKVAAALLASGCTWKQGKGDHIKWVLSVRQPHRRRDPGRLRLAGRRRRHDQQASLPAEGMVAVTTYVVRAKRWAHGWELHIDGIGVTQSRTLDRAEQMVRDYVETLTDRDVSDATIVIEPDLGGLEAKAADVREQIEQAQRENRQAAAASRALAGELRAAGLSVSDTATVLGVSRGRVSQLVSGSHQVA